MQVPPNPLIVALDLPDRASIVSLASQLAGEVGMVKVGYEAYLRYGGDLLSELADLGHRIFLDLKLHDIPRTVAAGVKAVRRPELGLLTIHAAGGSEMVAAAVEASDGLFDVVAVTLLTSLDEATVRSVGYQQSVPEHGEAHGGIECERRCRGRGMQCARANHSCKALQVSGSCRDSTSRCRIGRPETCGYTG